MKHCIEFEVGQQYQNRKGTYEVLAINGNEMHIIWKSGEEIVTTVGLQQRIIEAMQEDHSQLSLDNDQTKRKDVRQYTGGPVQETEE